MTALHYPSTTLKYINTQQCSSDLEPMILGVPWCESPWSLPSVSDSAVCVQCERGGGRRPLTSATVGDQQHSAVLPAADLLDDIEVLLDLQLA